MLERSNPEGVAWVKTLKTDAPGLGGGGACAEATAESAPLARTQTHTARRRCTSVSISFAS